MTDLPQDVEQMNPEQQEAAAYRAYQANVRRSEELMEQVLLGAREGEPLASLLLKTSEAISRMTNNRSFLDQMDTYVRSVYGEALLDEGALALKKQEVADRIRRLEEALGKTDEPDVRNAIRLTIKAHRERLERLEKLDGEA